MAQPSAKYQLIEHRLDQTLASFIEARRPHKSWTRIAEEIYQRTQVDVSDESLRMWFVDRITVETSVRVA